jgi:lysophosphatidate acyltransferase
MNILKLYLAVPVAMISGSLVGYVFPFQGLRYWSRAVSMYYSLILCASYGVIASILLHIVGRPTLSQWATAQSFSLLTAPLVDWEWDVQGEEILGAHRPAVFISNHQRYSLPSY